MLPRDVLFKHTNIIDVKVPFHKKATSIFKHFRIDMIIFHDTAKTKDYSKLCSSPCNNISFGKLIPIKTILVSRGSPNAHLGPRSDPMTW